MEMLIKFELRMYQQYVFQDDFNVVTSMKNQLFWKRKRPSTPHLSKYGIINYDKWIRILLATIHLVIILIEIRQDTILIDLSCELPLFRVTDSSWIGC